MEHNNSENLIKIFWDLIEDKLVDNIDEEIMKALSGVDE
jgi:hypothetical protein